MPIRTAGNAGAVHGRHSRARLTPRRLAGLVVLAIAFILLVIVLFVAAFSS